MAAFYTELSTAGSKSSLLGQKRGIPYPSDQGRLGLIHPISDQCHQRTSECKVMG